MRGPRWEGVTGTRFARITCVPVRRVAAVCLMSASVLPLLSACADRDGNTPPPPADAVVRQAALSSLEAAPVAFRLRMVSPAAEYVARGVVDPATDRFRGAARVRRSPRTLHDTQIETIGVGGETYEINVGSGFEPANVSGCAYDPHQPVGNLGDGASVQEAMTLIAVAPRLLRDGVRRVTATADGEYRVVVDPDAATIGPNGRGSDERIVADPRRLARRLGAIRVTIAGNGLIRRLALELRDFRPAAQGPVRLRQSRRERVSLTYGLGPYERRLRVQMPRCVAME